MVVSTDPWKQSEWRWCIVCGYRVGGRVHSAIIGDIKSKSNGHDRSRPM